MTVEILLFTIMSTLVSIVGIYELSMKAIERYRKRRKEALKTQKKNWEKDKTYDVRNIMSQLQTIPHQDKEPVTETIEEEEHKLNDAAEEAPTGALGNLFAAFNLNQNAPLLQNDQNESESQHSLLDSD